MKLRKKITMIEIALTNYIIKIEKEIEIEIDNEKRNNLKKSIKEYKKLLEEIKG